MKTKTSSPLQKALRRIEKIGDAKASYFLCPDSRCKLFTDPTRSIPCDGSCPRKAKIALLCWHCLKAFTLFHNSRWCRFECPECGAWSFERMSGHYRRVNLSKKARRTSVCPKH